MGGGGGGIPQNLSGLWGGTGAAAGAGANTARTGTTQAVADDKGVLKAFDPTTMASTTPESSTPQQQYAPPAGYDASGLPSYITNWMSSGGRDASGNPMAMPTQSVSSTTPIGGAHAGAIGAAGGLLSSPQGYLGAPTPATTPRAATAPRAAAAPAGNTWAPMQGPEPPTTLTAIQKKMVESGQIPTNSPEVKDWLRWKLGEMGYTNRVAGAINTNSWEKQRAWNQYGGPTANNGSYAGVPPPGYSAHQWYGQYL